MRYALMRECVCMRMWNTDCQNPCSTVPYRAFSRDWRGNKNRCRNVLERIIRGSAFSSEWLCIASAPISRAGSTAPRQPALPPTSSVPGTTGPTGRCPRRPQARWQRARETGGQGRRGAYLGPSAGDSCSGQLWRW